MTDLPSRESRADLTDRADLEALLGRFYGRVLVDDVLAEPFREVREVTGIDAHIPRMADFWETVLFRAGRYRRNALHAHQHVQQRVPLSARHFQRWLTLWNATVDQMYRGPVAEHAKIQAARIATSLHRRLTGTHATELEVSAASQASISRREPLRPCTFDSPAKSDVG